MLHAAIFVAVVIGSYMLFAKLFAIGHQTCVIVKSIYRKILEYKVSRTIKKQKADKKDLKKRFEAKGWRIAK